MDISVTEPPIDKRWLRAAFERAAPNYDAAAVVQREVERRLLDRLEWIRLQPRRILDLGAGTGHATAALRKRYRGAQVVALDLALAMLQRVRARNGRWRGPQLICGEAAHLPLADASCDLVFSSLTLQWCTDLDAVFTELRRVLRPNGLLLFSSFGPETLKELRAAWAAADGEVHVNEFADLRDVGDAMLRVGLADPVADVERLTVTYEDAQILMRDLKAIGAHNVHRDRPRGLMGRGRLLRVIEAYEAYRCDGRLPATYEVVYGHAWRLDLGVAAAPPT